jgi:hypothetical protein
MINQGTLIYFQKASPKEFLSFFNKHNLPIDYKSQIKLMQAIQQDSNYNLNGKSQAQKGV